jgi:hypothetical protein
MFGVLIPTSMKVALLTFVQSTQSIGNRRLGWCGGKSDAGLEGDNSFKKRIRQ